MTDSQAVQPRGMIIIDGAALDTPHVSWEIDTNTNYQADTFRAEALISEDPETSFQNDLTYWANLANGQIEILGGFPANPGSFSKSELTSFLMGQIDEIHVDLGGNKVELYGRDYTSYFLDTKTSEKFQGKKASEIAQILAQRHGLATQITPTSTLVGTYYQIDHINMQSDRSEWDLLTYLAQQEGYDCYLKGRTLVFQPKEEAGPTYEIDVTMPSAATGALSSSAIDLRFVRNLTLAGDVTVILRSWNQKQKKGFSVKSPPRKARNALNPPRGNRPPQVYTFTAGNKTQQQAQERANQLAEDISRHEINLEATLPGDTVLTGRHIVAVKGTGTALDQLYYPDSIIRELDWEDGFEMRVHAKNHQTESTVTP